MINSKQPATTRRVKSPFNGVDVSSNLTHLIRDISQPKNAVFIQSLKIKPGDQNKVPLGSFTDDNPPKGFLVEIDPDPMPANSVVTEVVSLGSHHRYTLYMQIANYSAKALNAEIWRL
jgi:hypothetical protein